MAKKTTSKHQQLLYKTYQSSNRSLKNRMAKLERHIKRFPNDEQAKKALKNGLVDYRRKKPRTKVWNRMTKEMAHLLRSIGLNGNLSLKWEGAKNV